MRPLLIAVLILSAISLWSAPKAHAQTAPTTEIDHAACYRSVIDTDDIFCLGRFELPESISDGVSDAWCTHLVNQTGCNGTPADPEEPTSIPFNVVFLRLYEDCTAGGDCSAGTLINVSRIPRVGYGLVGSYIDAGHNVTWDDSSVYLCVESSTDPTIFGTPSSSCRAVFWSPATNTTEAQRDALGADLIDQVRAISVLESLPSSAYVENNLINSTGKVFAIEALANADRILDVFTEGSSAIDVPDVTPVAVSTVQASINSSTANVQSAKSDFGTNVLGISGDATGVLISLLILASLFVLLLVMAGPSGMIFALVGSLSAASALTVFGLLPFQVLAIFIVILAMPAAVKVVRMVTQ